MSIKLSFVTLAIATLAILECPAQNSVINTNIDMQGFLEVSRQAAVHRASRRLSEADFIRMSSEPGTAILDARSRPMFDRLRVKGAVHLSFSDITVDSLARLFPDKGQRILIYCNNNFRHAPGAFPPKIAPASLNLSTYVSLYSYGYTNVYELGPFLDIRQSKIAFEGKDEPSR